MKIDFVPLQEKHLILSKNPDVKEVIVDPAPTNIRAIRAYEKAGFISSGVIDTPDGPAVLMKFSIR